MYVCICMYTYIYIYMTTRDQSRNHERCDGWLDKRKAHHENKQHAPMRIEPQNKGHRAPTDHVGLDGGGPRVFVVAQNLEKQKA